MKTFPARLSLLSALIWLAIAGPAVAQSGNAGHDSHHGTATVTMAADAMTAAEVRKVDKAAMKITLRHEAIRNLDMAPMTMVFQVQDAALLDQVQAGDRVRFTADKIKGAYVVLTLERLN